MSYRAALLLLLIPAGWVAWTARDLPHLGAAHDDSIYWVSAKSLAETGEYRIESLAGRPWQTKYPPLFPAYLAIVWRLAPEFPRNLPWAMIACWIFFPVWLLLAIDFFRLSGVPRTLVIVLAISEQAIQFSATLMPELMFACFSMGAASLAWRGMGLAAGVAAAAAYLTKSAGLPLLGAIPLYFAVQKKYRQAAEFCAPLLAAIICWNGWMRGHISPSGDVLDLYYTNYFGYHLYNIGLRDVPAVITANADRLLWAIGGLLCGIGESAWPAHLAGWLGVVAMLWRAIGLIALVGLLRHCRLLGWNPFHLFTAGYLALLVIWHYPPNERFVFPVFPVLLAAVWVEGARFPRPRLWGMAAACACTGIALAGLFYSLPRLFDYSRRNLAENRRAYDWISAHAPCNAAVLAYDDPVLYLYTGRPAARRVVPTRYFYRQDRNGVTQLFDRIGRFAVEHRLSYVMTARADYHGELLPNDLIGQLQQRVGSHPGLALVYRSGAVAIYRCGRDARMMHRFQSTSAPYQ